MSRVAKQPVALPQGVTATVTDDAITVKGAKGSLSLPLRPGVTVKQDGQYLKVTFDGSEWRPAGGSTRAHLANMVQGVSKGYEKKLELVGVGYRAAVQGKTLVLALGYSHDINYPIPDGIDIKTPKPTEITISGIDKQRVGQVAAEIREFRGPEPYKGKGVKYAGEYIFRKEGKKK